MTSSKQDLVNRIILELENDLQVLETSARQAHEAATHGESKAEDQYDTRGLEASYLAAAQAKRAGELQLLLQQFRSLTVRSFQDQDPIAVTALVELEHRWQPGRKAAFYFLVPHAGGMHFEWEGKTIQVISTRSPLGEELLGRVAAKANDQEFEVELEGGVMREYRLISTR